MVRYDDDAEFRLLYADYKEDEMRRKQSDLARSVSVDPEDTISPVEMGADDDANAAVADDYGMTFVYTSCDCKSIPPSKSSRPWHAWDERS